jgi:hypothetical protein
VSRMSACAKFLGIDQEKAPSASANLVPPGPKNAPGFDGMRPRGMPHDGPTNFHGCWFCLEEGRIRLNCQKYKDDCARSDASRRAAILAGRGRPQNPVGGMATTGSSDSGELSSQWVIDSGASTHVCNDVRLMNNVHWYHTPIGFISSHWGTCGAAQGLWDSLFS